MQSTRCALCFLRFDYHLSCFSHCFFYHFLFLSANTKEIDCGRRIHNRECFFAYKEKENEAKGPVSNLFQLLVSDGGFRLAEVQQFSFWDFGLLKSSSLAFLCSGKLFPLHWGVSCCRAYSRRALLLSFFVSMCRKSFVFF